MYATQNNGTESPEIDHNRYPQWIKGKSAAELAWTIKDCREALQANPQNPKAGYYQDEIHYCAMELQRRRDGKS